MNDNKVELEGVCVTEVPVIRVLMVCIKYIDKKMAKEIPSYFLPIVFFGHDPLKHCDVASLG